MQEKQETQAQSLSREDPLEEGMAAHSSILAWRIPWREEPGGLQCVGLQRVGRDWSDWTQRASGFAPSGPFRWFFLHSLDSSFSWTDYHSAEDLRGAGALHRSRILSASAAVSSLVLFLANSRYICLTRSPISSTQLREITGLHMNTLLSI